MINEEENKSKSYEQRDVISAIKERMSKGLTISRIPSETHDWFVSFAKQEFCGDYGMALKHLRDVYTGLISSGIEHLQEEIIMLSNGLDELRDSIKEKKEEKNTRKMIDGSERRK